VLLWANASEKYTSNYNRWNSKLLLKESFNKRKIVFSEVTEKNELLYALKKIGFYPSSF